MAYSRKKSREIVFRMLFSLGEFEDVLALACDEDELPTGPELQYIQNLYDATNENLEDIDSVIKSHLVGYTIDRINKTDLACLRLGISEMKHTETNKIVIINEVVNIAKKYGTQKSGGFVNGVLAKCNS